MGFGSWSGTRDCVKILGFCSMFGLTHLARCGRDTGEMQARCRRDAGETPARNKGDTGEKRGGCGSMLLHVRLGVKQTLAVPR